MNNPSKPQFTPGPWEVKDPPMGEDHKPYRIYACPGRVPVLVASLPSRTGSMGQMDRANVRLVAAAPQMFALLERIADMLSVKDEAMGDEERCFYEAIQVFLKKIKEEE